MHFLQNKNGKKIVKNFNININELMKIFGLVFIIIFMHNTLFASEITILDTQKVYSEFYGKPDVIFIDNRPEVKAQFLGKIKGATVLTYFSPGSSENQMTKAKLQKIAKNKRIVFYCSGMMRAYWAAKIAVDEWGFKKEKIFWYKQGFNDWINKSYPIDKVDNK